eukprot:g3474.t1
MPLGGKKKRKRRARRFRDTWLGQTKAKLREPWNCVLCKKENKFDVKACTQCGKAAPVRLTLEDYAAKKLQGLFRSRKARANIRLLLQSVFAKEYDPESGYYYYINTRTGETSWEKPKLLDDSADIQIDAKRQKEINEQIDRDKAQETREAKRLETALEEEQKRLEELEKDRQNKWQAALKGARQTGELLNCWKGLEDIDEECFTITNMTAMRLVGHRLSKIPSRLVTDLKNLQVLSLSNNNLDHLPENIGDLVHLKELNLLKNKLVDLPDSICNLKDLVILEISNNRLRNLPERIGNLQKLPRLTVESNELCELPDSLCELKCRALRLAHNHLQSLPEGICESKTLEQLCIDNNELQELPFDIGNVETLHTITACNNHIHQIPQSLITLPNIKRLWLDWNRIETLPDGFENMLALETLKLEGNPMRDPALQVLIDGGVEGTKKWCQHRSEFKTKRNRKEILQWFLQILHTISENKLATLDFFEEGMVTSVGQNANAPVFSFVLGDVWSKCALKAHRMNIEKVSGTTGVEEGEDAEEKSYVNNPLMNPKELPFLESDVRDAIEFYVDPFGPCGLVNTKCLFKRCSCRHKKTGKRRVCVPPKVGYQCERDGCQVKKQLGSFDDLQKVRMERERQVELEKKEAIARQKAEDYVSSLDGQIHFQELAIEEAMKASEEDRRQAFIQKNIEALDKKKKGADNRRNKKRAAMEKRKQKNISKLVAKKEKLTKRKERLFGWELEKCVEDINDIEDELEHLPEDDELMLLDNDEEEALQEYEAAKKLIESGDGYVPRSKMEKNLKVNTSKEHKMLKERIEQELISAYIRKMVAQARKQVNYEFKIMAKIMKRWQFVMIGGFFDHWAFLVYDKREHFAEMARKEEEQRILDEGTSKIMLEQKEIELAKWKEDFDEWTDKPYWVHEQTGKTTYIQPTMENVVYRPDGGFLLTEEEVQEKKKIEALELEEKESNGEEEKEVEVPRLNLDELSKK